MVQSAQTGAVVGGTIGVVLSLVVGGVIGWLASIVMKSNAQMGLVANVLVGIVGSWLGGFLFGKLGLGGGTILSVVAAVAGAALLIALLRAAKVLK